MQVDRSQYIGSTDTAALLGLSPWAGKHDVYLKLLGMGPEHKSSSWEFWYGLHHEQLSADAYEFHYGKKVVGQQAFFQHKEYPWLGGHVDGLVLHEQFKDFPVSFSDQVADITRIVERGVEFKTANPRYIHDWGDGPLEVPQQYLIQCQHFMAITGVNQWDLCISIGNMWKRYEIQRDIDIGVSIIEAAKHCWLEVDRLKQLRVQNLLAFSKELSEISAGDEEARKHIAQTIYPRAKVEAVEVPDEHKKLLNETMDAKNNLEKAEKHYEKLANDCKLAMGETRKWENEYGSAEWRNQGKGRAFIVKRS